MFAPIASSQETEVWACQGTEATGIEWQTEEGYRWESTRVTARDMLLTVDGINSSYNLDSQNIPLTCQVVNEASSEKIVSCVRANGLAYDFLVLNPVTGQAALSQMGGAITSNTFYRDLVITNIFQCTKS